MSQNSKKPFIKNLCVLSSVVLLLLLLVPLPATAGDIIYSEDFEADNGGYSISGGNPSWAWGSPTNGPGSAHSGNNAWATNLSGDYNSNENAYLSSPNIDLSTYADMELELSWWQYIHTEEDYDFASVEISNDGGGTWLRVYGRVSGEVTTEWTEVTIPLDASYAVSNFRVRFRSQSDALLNFPGFYVDDVEIEAKTFIPVHSEDFEADNGGYSGSGSTSWEWGVPTSGPGSAHSGNNVWATNLDGDYNIFENGYATAPAIDLSAYVGQELRLSWWQYIHTEAGYDFASVEISSNGGGSWSEVYKVSGEVTTEWTEVTMPLDASYAVSNFRVRFRLRSDSYLNFPGFYVDDVTVLVESGLLSDLSITKTANPTTAEPGDFLTYTLAFSNTGKLTATDVFITDTVPITLTNVSYTSSGAVITATGSVSYTWQVEDLDPDEGGVITITGRLNTGLPAGYVFNNTASIATSLEEMSTNNNSSSAEVTVANAPPVASDGSLTTDEDTPVSGILQASDANGDTLTYDILTNPDHGTVAITDAATGSFAYTPTQGFNGIDSFVYIVTDPGSLTDTATVTITVKAGGTPGNDPPNAVDDTATTTKGTPVTISVLANDTDPQSDPLTVTAVGTPANGSATTNGTTVAYTPTPDFEGTDVFTYTASDGSLTDTATVTVQVEGSKPMAYVYLPRIVKNHVLGPDLVVEQVIATSISVQVVIRNQGSMPVIDMFWVDFYVDPNPAPTHVNQAWSDLGSEGLVWGIPHPMAAGEAITLTVGDIYYRPDYSYISWPLSTGTSVYAQVDSVNLDTTYGAVLEAHEIGGGTYNNISEQVLSTATFRDESAAVKPSATGDHQLTVDNDLPRR